MKKFKNNDSSVEIRGLSVEVRNGDVNYALRKFKKKIQESGILQELRQREFYEKPSETRKKAKAAAKFANPDNASETWSGRGRQPAWYKTAVSDGKSPESMEI